MQKAKILNTREAKQILRHLEDQWGFKEKIEMTFLMNEKDKIFIISNDLKILQKPEELRIDSLGLYFGELNKGEIRLSIEGSQIVGPKAGKNIIEVSRPEMTEWFKGKDIEKNIEGEPRYVILKHDTDFIGTGRYKDGKILNFVPKARRLDSQYEED